MNRKNIYLGMTILGTLAPPIAGATYLLEHGYNPAHLMPAIFSSPVSAMVGINVIIGCITLAILMHTEGRELGVKTWLADSGDHRRRHLQRSPAVPLSARARQIE